jgi:hypothetical protein
VTWAAERGQAAVEFCIVASALLILTFGLIDTGRGFYQYNAVANAARDAARWAAVVGGACSPGNVSSSDWCTQMGAASSGTFWQQAGNAPLQQGGLTCPATHDVSRYPGYFYTVSNYTSTSSTTIVGAVAHRLDSSSVKVGFVRGDTLPGFDLSRVAVCIELPQSWDASKSMYLVQPGQSVGVFIYDSFSPAGPLLGRSAIPLNAAAEDEIEVER